MADRYLPDSCHPAKSIQSVALVKVHRRRVHHLLAAHVHSEVANRLDRTHAHPAIESALKAFAPSREKIARPSIEANAVNKIRRTLRGLEVVLAARIIGIADAAVAIAIVDAVLAPDLALAHMNALVLRRKRWFSASIKPATRHWGRYPPPTISEINWSAL